MASSGPPCAWQRCTERCVWRLGPVCCAAEEYRGSCSEHDDLFSWVVVAPVWTGEGLGGGRDSGSSSSVFSPLAPTFAAGKFCRSEAQLYEAYGSKIAHSIIFARPLECRIFSLPIDNTFLDVRPVSRRLSRRDLAAPTRPNNATESKKPAPFDLCVREKTPLASRRTPTRPRREGVNLVLRFSPIGPGEERDACRNRREFVLRPGEEGYSDA